MAESLEGRIGALLGAKKQLLATAESCSGGLIAHRLTNSPGSSHYFQGGVVSYSNAAKVELLGVKQESLDRYGAVSDAVAREMAEGALKRFEADWAIACTGIAGPDGGTAEKPVGLVYIAVAGVGGTTVERCQFDGDRMSVKQQTAERALVRMLEALS